MRLITAELSADTDYFIITKMKKLYLLIAFIFVFECGMAQIPYFTGTVGNGRLYGYTSLKFRPGINAQETYTTFQYGLGDSFAAGLDLSTARNSAYGGILLRYGHRFSPYFGIGGQVTPSFDLNDSMSFKYLTAALYMNGNILKNGNLFWVSNTWWGVNRHAANTVSQYLYLGYNIKFRNGHSITPMLGEIHSWKFDQDVDIAAGFYYTIKSWNFYLWGNDFLKSHPRIIVGVDFAL